MKDTIVTIMYLMVVIKNIMLGITDMMVGIKDMIKGIQGFIVGLRIKWRVKDQRQIKRFIFMDHKVT